MITTADIPDVQKVCDHPELVSYCSLMFRPGIRAWMTEIEYTRFRPGTLRNDDFHVAIVKWPEEVDTFWLIIIFHQSEQQFAEAILWKNGLRKVKEGFTQNVMSSKGIETFPISGPRVFFLENHVQGAANVIYSNDPVKMKAAKELEDKQCQVFFDAHEEWLKTPESKEAIKAYMRFHPEGYNQ